MNMPWHFVHVGFNETIKRLYCEDKEHTFSTYFICAALSGTQYNKFQRLLHPHAPFH